MSAIVIDNFSTYTRANLSSIVGFPWTYTGSGQSISTAQTRNSPASLRAAAGSGLTGRTFTGSPAWNYLGVAYYVASSSDLNVTVGFQCASGRVTVASMSNFSLVIRNGSTIVAQTAGNIININTWYYFEIRYNPSVPVVELYVNGVLTLTSAVNVGTPTGVRIRTPNVSTGGDVYITDLYAEAGKSTINTDNAVINILPSADLMPQDWTPSAGSDGFAVIDDIPFNDTTFIEAATANDVSDFGTSFSQTVFQVHAVSHQWRGLKSTPGAVNARASLRVGAGGTPIVGIDHALSETTADTFTDIALLNPDTGLPFTEADLAALIVTHERTA